MPSRNKKKEAHSAPLSAFLRSINIVLDVDHPDRVSHLRPTGKTVRYLQLLLEDGPSRTCLVAAPYGSGKSLVTSFAMQCVENKESSRATLKPVVDRLQELSPGLAKTLGTRIGPRSKRCGLSVPMHGHHSSVPEGIMSALAEAVARQGYGRVAGGLRRRRCETVEDVIAAFDDLIDDNKIDRLDNILIVWDEFGRHLETLAVEGRASALSDVQVLAEWASRRSGIRVNFVVLLHQGMLNYASSLPETARREWAKIEGRFERLDFVDDSVELMRLVGELVSGMRPKSCVVPTRKVVEKHARALRDAGLFSDIPLKDTIALGCAAFPLSLTALYMLPRIAARVAQNERTIFSFVQSLDFRAVSGPSMVYQYFSSAMQADTAPGGTYRRWLETESAASKVEDDNLVHGLQTCAVLSLGLAGERGRVRKDLLLEALAEVSTEESETTPEDAISELVSKKLLLHRRHSDEVSIWHGTDADLRAKQLEVRESIPEGFSLIDFLTKEFEPKIWRPTRFNDDYKMRRYVRTEYVSATQLEERDLHHLLLVGKLDQDEDARLYLVVPGRKHELSDLHALATECVDERVLIGVPSAVPNIEDAVLDLWSILELQKDQELLETDPLVADELVIMENDARVHVSEILDGAFSPSDSLHLFYKGACSTVPNRPLFLQWLSDVMESIYPSTPVLNNEIINRKKPSATVVNARKKLLESILERTESPEFGFEAENYEIGAAVKAMYRAVLKSSGLYGHAPDEGWGFRHPAVLKGNDGLRKAWESFRVFMQEPTPQPKSFERFFMTLQSPPFGMRAGVFPIFLAAAFQAFSKCTVLTKNDEYVKDIKPSDIEDICKNPALYKLTVCDLNENEEQYLDAIHSVFDVQGLGLNHDLCTVSEGDVFLRCMEIIDEWYEGLGESSKNTRSLSKPTQRFRSLLTSGQSPDALLLIEVPKVFGFDSVSDSSGDLLHSISNAVSEIFGVEQVNMEKARALFLRHVGCKVIEGAGFLESAQAWSHSLPDDVVRNLENKKVNAVVQASRRQYVSGDACINAIATVLTGRGIARWEDGDVKAFSDAIRSVARDLEDGMLDAMESKSLKKTDEKKISLLLESKLERVVEALRVCHSDDELQAVLDRYMNKEVTHGDH